MVGGKKEHLDTCLPVLEAMGSRVEHMGGWGAGAAAKLVNQVQALIVLYCSSTKTIEAVQCTSYVNSSSFLILKSRAYYV